MDYKAFSDPETCEYYRTFMSDFDIDMNRVTLRYSSDIFKALGEIDILLDSFPHNGGTMLYDALWMGVPVISLAGRPPLGRIGESAMSNLGLADWVAYDDESYINNAVKFASNLAELAKIRIEMRETMINSPLMDEKGFASDVENAYLNMWKKWCREALNLSSHPIFREGSWTI